MSTKHLTHGDKNMSMKCVKMDNNILRLRTDKARKLVTSGKASFVCKGIWKAWRKTQTEAANG